MSSKKVALMHLYCMHCTTSIVRSSDNDVSFVHVLILKRRAVNEHRVLQAWLTKVL